MTEFDRGLCQNNVAVPVYHMGVIEKVGLLKHQGFIQVLYHVDQLELDRVAGLYRFDIKLKQVVILDLRRVV